MDFEGNTESSTVVKIKCLMFYKKNYTMCVLTLNEYVTSLVCLM